MAPHPFQPMTTELLKKLSRVDQESDSTIKSPDLAAVFETQNHKTAIESNSQRSESYQSNLRTNNHY
jgi:hypothetical protein